MPPAYVEIIPTSSVNDNKQAVNQREGQRGQVSCPFSFLSR